MPQPALPSDQRGRSKTQLSASWRAMSVGFAPLFAAVWLLGCPATETEVQPISSVVWPSGDLVAVEVVDAEHVIVVAAKGDVYVSHDAGSSWTSAELPSTLALRDVSMADAEVGWLVGGTDILRSDDGGSSWHPQLVPDSNESLRLTSVAAIDRDRVVAIAAGGARLRTQDGGARWEVHPGPENIEGGRSRTFEALDCHRGGVGLCWTVGVDIDRSQDGGRRWSPVGVIDPLRIEPIPFGLAQVEMAGADATRIAAAIEGVERGADPEWQIEPRISRLEIEHFRRRRDADALLEVIAARIDEVRGRLEGAGVDLDRVVVFGAPPWDYANYLDDDPHFLDRYWKARSASSSSISLRVVPSRRMTAIAVGREGFGLAVGGEGALLRSLDGGASWTPLEPLSTQDLYDVAVGGERAVVVGAQGRLWSSTDRAGVWRVPAGSMRESPFFDALRGVSFSPAWELGVIVGERGRMLRSFDGGVGWGLLLPGEARGAR